MHEAIAIIPGHDLRSGGVTTHKGAHGASHGRWLAPAPAAVRLTGHGSAPGGEIHVAPSAGPHRPSWISCRRRDTSQARS